MGEREFLTTVYDGDNWGVWNLPKYRGHYTSLSLPYNETGLASLSGLNCLNPQDLSGLESAAKEKGIACITAVTISKYSPEGEVYSEDESYYPVLEDKLEEEGYTRVLTWVNPNSRNLLTLWGKVIQNNSGPDKYKGRWTSNIYHKSKPLAHIGVYPLCCGLGWVYRWTVEKYATGYDGVIYEAFDVSAVIFSQEVNKTPGILTPSLTYVKNGKTYGLYAHQI